MTQLLAPCWGQRSHSPAVCIGMMEEIKLQPSLKHLCCQKEKDAAEQALRVLLPLPSCPRQGWHHAWLSLATSLDGCCSAEATELPGLGCRQHRCPRIQAAALGETKLSGLSQLCQEGHWQQVSTEILCAAAARGREGCKARCNNLSCPPPGLLSCVLGASGVWGPGPGHCPGDAAVWSSIPALLLAVASGAGRGQAQVTHPLPMPGTPLRFSSLMLLFASSPKHVP